MFGFLLIVTIVISLLIGIGFHYWKIDRHIKRAITALLILLFSVIIAFRPAYVPDTLGYNEIFDKIVVGKNYGFNIFGEYLTVEYGFLYLMMFFKAIFNNVHVFYFILTYISCLIFAYAVSQLYRRFMKADINLPMLLGVFFSYYGIYYSGIAIRQGLALSLCLLAFYFFISKKYFRSILFLFVAILVHRLSVLSIVWMLFYILFRHKNFSIKFMIAVNILCLIYYVINLIIGFGGGIYVVADRVLWLVGLHDAFGGWLEDYVNIPVHLSMTNLFVCLQGFLLIYISRNSRELKFFCELYLIGEIISVLFANMYAASRLYDLFTIYSVFIISYILSICTAPIRRSVVNPPYNVIAKSRNVPLLMMGVLLICNIILVLNILGI